jgi:HSP20 family protein
MENRFPRNWMWSDAFEMLARAERMQRQFIQPPRSAVAWEPPVDVLETERAVLVLVAVPGVDLNKVEAMIDGNDLVVSGRRAYPPEMGVAAIHRLELPQGRFERRLRLPPGRYTSIERTAANGCLQITLTKAEARHD